MIASTDRKPESQARIASPNRKHGSQARIARKRNRAMQKMRSDMKTTATAILISLVVSIFFVSTAEAQEVPPPAKPPMQEEGMPAMPVTPASVTAVVEVIPFKLEKPYEHNMRKDRVQVTRGHVVVLRAPKPYLVARQVAEPVLLVGAQTAERINVGDVSGVLLVVVPEWSERGADGVLRAGEPLSARMIFATPELPERVDAAWISRELTKADAANIPPSIGRTSAVVPGFTASRALALVDRDALSRVLADLVERYSPNETDRIAALRAID